MMAETKTEPVKTEVKLSPLPVTVVDPAEFNERKVPHCIDHFRIYLYAVLVFMFFTALYLEFDWYFSLALLGGFFIVYPDLLDHLFPIKFHRNFVSHSVLYPIALYWIFRPWLDLTISAEYGMFLFYPMMIHLMVDFYSIVREIKGYATIKFFGKSLGKSGSLWFITVNVAMIIAYIFYFL